MQFTFMLDAPRAHTADDFLIRDVPGTSGRLDVVCRILAATFRTIPQFNSNLRFLAILGGPPDPPLLLNVTATSAESIPESELACVLILKGLLHQYRNSGSKQQDSWPHFSLTRQNFEETLQYAAKTTNKIYYLVENGELLENVKLDLSKPLTFLLGDDRGLPPEHETLLSKYKIQKVSVGEQSYLGSQVVTLVLLEIARQLKLKV